MPGWSKDFGKNKIYKIYHTSDPTKFYVDMTTSNVARQKYHAFTKLKGIVKDIDKLLEYKAAIDENCVLGRWKCELIADAPAIDRNDAYAKLTGYIRELRPALNEV